MALHPPRSDLIEPVESLAFDILMESVLKMSRLMNVSVFLLVEQSYSHKRRYGGCPLLCEAFKNGKLTLRGGDSVTEYVQLTEEEEEEKNEAVQAFSVTDYAQLTEEEEEEENEAAQVFDPTPREEDYEIDETVQFVEDVGGFARCLPVVERVGLINSFNDIYPNRSECNGKAGLDSNNQDSEYMVHSSGNVDDDDNADWSTEYSVKNMLNPKERTIKTKPKIRQKMPLISSSPPSVETIPHSRQSRPVGCLKTHHPKDTHIALQVRDFAEGRVEFESEVEWDFSEPIRAGGVIDGDNGVVQEEEEEEEEEEDYDEDIDRSRGRGRLEDDGVRDDSSEDDDWKPRNYGKGKLYQRERGRSRRKEMRRKSRITPTEAAVGDEKARATESGQGAEAGLDGESNVRLSVKDGGDCPHCHRFFHRIRQHIQEVHLSDRKYSCEYCASRFKREEHLKKHLRCIHKVSG